MGDECFSFPALPKPKPLETQAHRPQLPPTNPLLAGATVTDRSSGDSGGASTGAGPPGNMGATLGKLESALQQSGMPPPRGRKKVVPFEKGWSQMDWVRLTQSGADLSGLGGGRPRRGITMEEVVQHNTREDCWTVLRGKVYNLTPYLRFHPGGVPLLLKVAGRDGTALFNKYHAWVNYEFLLAKCLVGLLAPPSAAGTAAGAAGATASGLADAAGAAAAGSAGAVQQDAAARAGEGSSEQQQPDGGEAGAGGKEAQDGSDGGSSSAAVQAQQHEVAGGTETDVGGGQLVANKL